MARSAEARGEEVSGDEILLQGIQVPAALGVTAAERRMRRPVRVDVELGRDLSRAGRSDRIGDTIDYGDLFASIEEVASAQEHRLVEALGERIASHLLAKFEVDWVRVTVRKPMPLAGVLEYTGIRITRTRRT